ncbi:hypothetical protein D3C71_2190970 [compost metagenome]
MWSATSILDTKFSYPEKITISSRLPASDRSIRVSTARSTSFSCISSTCGTMWKISCMNFASRSTSDTTSPK